MKLITLNEKNETLETIENNDKYIMKVLIQQLWNKQMQVTKDIKRISYKYNYSDKQTVKVIFSNGYKYVFQNIPTVHGCIDI